jgi:hypothetical protein
MERNSVVGSTNKLLYDRPSHARKTKRREWYLFSSLLFQVYVVNYFDDHG